MFSRKEASLCKLYKNTWMCVRRTSGQLHVRYNVRGIKNMEKDAKFYKFLRSAQQTKALTAKPEELSLN